MVMNARCTVLYFADSFSSSNYTYHKKHEKREEGDRKSPESVTERTRKRNLYGLVYRVILSNHSVSIDRTYTEDSLLCITYFICFISRR